MKKDGIPLLLLDAKGTPPRGLLYAEKHHTCNGKQQLSHMPQKSMPILMVSGHAQMMVSKLEDAACCSKAAAAGIHQHLTPLVPFV